MTLEFPPGIRDLVTAQDGVLSRRQAVGHGLDWDVVRGQLRYGRWQRLRRGVYAPFTGPPPRAAELWAALLRAGDDAIFSHQTAAELAGFLKRPAPFIHIMVPVDRNPARYAGISGVVIHRSRRIDEVRHPALAPPRTKVEETVLDLVESADDFDNAFNWICAALGDKCTTADRLLAALATRKRMPNRRDIEILLGDARQGVRSWLERQYVRGVEKPHGLPLASRQWRLRLATVSRYLDNLYAAYKVCVELDGTAAHSGAQQLQDKRRDRRNAVERQILTLRFGYPDVRTAQSQCETAAEVAAVLRDRGPHVGMACDRPGCPV
jgi:hypothetical protein